MEATNLRIGNLVSPTENLKKEFWENVFEVMPDYIEVSQTAKDGIIHCIFDGEYDFDIKQLQPIELTKQWLIDFGFELNNDKFKDFVFDDMNAYIKRKTRFGTVWFSLIINNTYIRFIQTVHELQNIYYFLSGGIELTLKNK